jgi:hypothetical protein
VSIGVGVNLSKLVSDELFLPQPSVRRLTEKIRREGQLPSGLRAGAETLPR